VDTQGETRSTLHRWARSIALIEAAPHIETGARRKPC